MSGRPTDYTDEVLQIARDYLDNFNEEYEHAIPSVVGLAKVLKKHRDTLYEWAKHEDKKEFSDILKKINDYQRFELINGGLTNKFNGVITKLMLGQHGIHEKAQQELSGPGGGPIEHDHLWTIEIVDAEDADSEETGKVPH